MTASVDKLELWLSTEQFYFENQCARKDFDIGM